MGGKLLNEKQLYNYFNFKNSLGKTNLFDENENIEINPFLVRVKNKIKTYDQYKQKLKKILITEILKSLKKSNKVFIPLSGGYDSRVIVAVAKKFNLLKKVKVYTYGPKNNSETLMSKKIAKKLKIPFYFVEYTDNLISQKQSTSQFKDWILYCFKGGRTPHGQDYYAIDELIKKKIIKKGDTIIPGHSGDFIAGSRLDKIKMFDFSDSNDFINSVIKYHSLRFKFPKKIKKQLLKYHKTKTSDDFEFFDWQERQIKYINNSCRNYSFFNLKYELPLWSNKLVNFYNSVPNKYRINKLLYDSVVRELFIETGINFKPVSVNRNILLQKIIKIYLKLPDFLKKMILNIWFIMNRIFINSEKTRLNHELKNISFRKDPELKKFKKYGFGKKGKESVARLNDYAFYLFYKKNKGIKIKK